MEQLHRAIALLSDSQLLFWRRRGRPFLASLREGLPGRRPRAAYLGASNGDRPEFFEIFLGAMAGAGVGSEDCRLIPTRPSREDLRFFDSADLILLAGGDPGRGWKAFERSGLGEGIVERYEAGAQLIGISAGAMLLGLFGIGEGDETPFGALRLVPYLVDAHDEPEWPRLRGLLGALGPGIRGLGLPSGGGALFRPDRSLESIRYPLVELAS